ncbi:MAG: adenosylcobinamide-GDP ribazoletransferase [Deltaproteobacteria bacterium]|nr:adenosylcobinamide-GDP ribazoletransferase [Deltaproteobacteria bacterium]MCL5793089.1 adenosylcobinamide-GDP ribazoletransferase [Deltaproteobacteria bacterium]
MRKLLIAFQFLTILPVKISEHISEYDIAGSSMFFPVVGAFQGAVAVLLAALLRDVFCGDVACHATVEIISVLVIMILIITNKGLHFDGLADTFDALGVAPTGTITSDIEKRLSAMKDSRIGSIGAIGIVFTILIKFVLLNALFLTVPWGTVYLLLFIMPVFSKWAMVPALYYGTSARQEGIGRIFIDYATLAHLIASTVLAMGLAGVALYTYSIFDDSLLNRFLLFFVLFLILYGFSIVSMRLSKKRFGGITGDILGAISELSEVVFLMVVVLWLNH